MLDKLTQISLLKEKFIQERKKVLEGSVSDAQRKLYEKLFNKLIASLETEEGRILNNNGNIASTTAIDKIFKEFEADLSKLMMVVAKDYTRLIGYNQQYFSKFNTTLFKSVESRVTKAMEARAGFNSKGFEKDGFIDSFIKDKSLARTVKQQVLSAVLNGTKITDLTKTLKVSINGKESGAGILDNHFKTYIYDTYSQFDSETGNQFAVQLELNYGIYAGGLVDASRPFCIERNGKVFTREEIQKFGTPQDKFGGYTNKSKGEFAGKNKDYLPERDRGGYNCGHILNWVSLTIAKRKRPDIPKSIYDKQRKQAA
jgi:hypothetical protein